MQEADENYRCFIGVAIREALRKLEVLSWCSQNRQLFDATGTYSIDTLLHDRRKGLDGVLREVTAYIDGPLSQSSQEEAIIFRASSSSGEDRLYYDRVEYLRRCKEIAQLRKIFKVLRYKCHEMNQKLHLESQIEMARHRFIRYSDGSRKEQLQHSINGRLEHLQLQRETMYLHKTDGIKAAAATEKFYQWKLESTEQQIEDWMNRFDQEKEEQDARFQKARAAEKYWNELMLQYDQQQQEMEALEKALSRWSEEMKHKQLCGRMATKLQAWWRGVMVRKGLGRFGPQGRKKPKGKGKEKGKKKGKK